MSRFSATLLAATLTLAPTLAMADPVGIPNLTFPITVTPPETQGCTDPAPLTPACKPAQ